MLELPKVTNTIHDKAKRKITSHQPESLPGHDANAELGDGDVLGRYPDDVERACAILK